MQGSPLAAYTAALFDMDGLLVDSNPCWQLAEREVFGAVGVPVDEALQTLAAAMTTNEVARFWYARHPWEGPSIEEIERAVVSRVAELVARAEEKPGVSALLDRLRRLDMRIALASNAPGSLCHRILAGLRLSERFDHVQSADTVHAGKPDPAVYLAAAHALGVDPGRCLVFEDTLTGARAACAAGMDVVVVPSDAAEASACIDIGARVLDTLAGVDEAIVTGGG